jgi:hypothetical protein
MHDIDPLTLIGTLGTLYTARKRRIKEMQPLVDAKERLQRSIEELQEGIDSLGAQIEDWLEFCPDDNPASHPPNR